MNVCIIGAGNVGSTLARKLVVAGHSVRISNSRGAESLKSVAAQTCATPMSLREGTRGVAVVVLAVPFASIPLLRWILFTLPPDVVVADTSNYLPFRDGPIAAIDRGDVESLWVSEQIGRPVIKAWNNALAATLSSKGTPSGTAGRIALSVAGDDLAGKEMIKALVDDTGFDAIDGGPLVESWRQQPITRAYCTEFSSKELAEALAAVRRDERVKRRDFILKEISTRKDLLTTSEMVRLNRTHGA